MVKIIFVIVLAMIAHILFIYNIKIGTVLALVPLVALIFDLLKTSNKIDKNMNKKLKDDVYKSICNNGSRSIIQLCDQFHKNKRLMTRIIDNLCYKEEKIKCADMDDEIPNEYTQWERR